MLSSSVVVATQKVWKVLAGVESLSVCLYRSYPMYYQIRKMMLVAGEKLVPPFRMCNKRITNLWGWFGFLVLAFLWWLISSNIEPEEKLTKRKV